MEDMEWKGSIYRIKKCVSDLQAMEDDLFDDDEDGDDFSWELMARDLSLKSTFLYCDLNRVIAGACDDGSYCGCLRRWQLLRVLATMAVIAGACDDGKKVLTDLANRLFYFLEELGCAVKRRSVSLAQVHYSDAAHVSQVLAALATASPR